MYMKKLCRLIHARLNPFKALSGSRVVNGELLVLDAVLAKNLSARNRSPSTYAAARASTASTVTLAVRARSAGAATHVDW